MKKWLRRPEVRSWLAVLGASTLVLAAAYAMVQQSTRLSADDQPIVIGKTMVKELAGGAQPSDTVPNLNTDLREDPTVFAIVTDSGRHILASSASLDGKTPLPPAGTFEFTKNNNTDHFTWEPANGVRLATRMYNYGTGDNGGFIITGQSLEQAENKIKTYTVLVVAAWIAVFIWTSVIYLSKIGMK